MATTTPSHVSAHCVSARSSAPWTIGSLKWAGGLPRLPIRRRAPERHDPAEADGQLLSSFTDRLQRPPARSVSFRAPIVAETNNGQALGGQYRQRLVRFP